jgi:hypothetical protein
MRCFLEAKLQTLLGFLFGFYRLLRYLVHELYGFILDDDDDKVVH